MLWILALACRAKDLSSTPEAIDSGEPAGDSAETGIDSAPQNDTGTPADSGTPPETGDSGKDTGEIEPAVCGHLRGGVSLGGTGWDGAMPGAAKADGSRYEILYFQDAPITFDAGGAHETTFTPTGTVNAALALFDPSGSFQWARQIGSAYSVTLEGVAVTSDGGAAVVGAFYESIDIAHGESTHAAYDNAGMSDGYVARFDAAGTLLWSQVFAGEDYEFATDVAVLSDDTVVVAGLHGGETVVADGQPEEMLLKLQTGAQEAGLVLAFGDDGTFVWAQQQYSTGYAPLYGIAVDPSTDEIVVGGSITGETVFGSDQPGEVTIVSDTFSGSLARYDATGLLLDATEIPHATIEDLDATDDGGVVAAGDFSGAATVGPGEPTETVLHSAAFQEAWTGRFDATGALVWAVQSISPKDTNTVARAVASDGTGGLVVTGDFTVGATFGSGEAAETVLLTGGTYDLFAAHYDVSGALVCVVQISGEDVDAGVGVLRLPDGSYEVVDQYMGTTVAGAGTTDEAVFTASGDSDVLLARYDF